MSKDSSRMLFQLLDVQLDEAAKSIANRVFAECQDLAWTPEYRRSVRSHIRQELNFLVWNILGSFDNVGGVLPDEIEGFKIINKQDNTDVRHEHDDYADMWQAYLGTRK